MNRYENIRTNLITHNKVVKANITALTIQKARDLVSSAENKVKVITATHSSEDDEEAEKIYESRFNLSKREELRLEREELSKRILARVVVGGQYGIKHGTDFKIPKRGKTPKLDIDGDTPMASGSAEVSVNGDHDGDVQMGGTETRSQLLRMKHAELQDQLRMLVDLADNEEKGYEARAKEDLDHYRRLAEKAKAAKAARDAGIMEEQKKPKKRVSFALPETDQSAIGGSATEQPQPARTFESMRDVIRRDSAYR